MPRAGAEPAQDERTEPTQATTPPKAFSSSCRTCGCGWSGQVLCHCSSCHQILADSTVFDAHLDKRGRCRDVSALNVFFPASRKSASCRVWILLGDVDA